MAASVVNSSEGINNYRNQIASAISKLEEQLTKTQGAIDTVGQTWKDGNFTEFQQNFETEQQMISSLLKVLNTYHDEILYQLECKLKEYEGIPMSID